ncbi:hypothetical protein WICPIJ_002592 [Wickerhamomyces pijperi]|uniref:DUF202 domain-containing protein n=1 Tax=Wickerhamomyces pijperi TaxID=599730 RepID=A0A9P8Q9A0_WICPI|nr:hypothetical protein WICPIJ_002592 [Wickerhamomyces pijperi]
MRDVNDITAQADTATDPLRLTTENIETIQQQQTPQPSSSPLQTEQPDTVTSTNERAKMDESSPFVLDRSAWNLYGALDLGSEFIENKGPMANERTFLSWMRTSLALSSAGVGVTQLFKIATSGSDDERSEFLRDIGKPLGGMY